MKRLNLHGASLMLALLISCGICASTFAQAKKPPRDDTQQWNDVQVAVPLSKTVDYVMTGTLRFGRNVSHPVDERLGFGFSFKAGKYLTLFPAYTYIRTQPLAGNSFLENRLTFAATLKAPLGKFSISDRNQFERRYRQPQINSTRYRNRLQLEHPFKLGSTPFTWFIGDEVFYDWSVNHWVRNRFSVGASHKFNKHFTGDLFYLRQNDGRTKPGDLHVIGTTFRFRL
jgi:Protein of unknown function (DUF2490)